MLSSLLRRHKSRLAGALYLGGLFHLLRRRQLRQGRPLTIATFHRVDDRPADDPHSLPTLFVGREPFARFLQAVRGWYDVIDSAGLEAARRDSAAGRPRLLITFDDGYADVFEHGVPRLAEAGLPATVFLPTRFITERSRTFWWDQAFSLLRRRRRSEALQRAVGDLLTEIDALPDGRERDLAIAGAIDGMQSYDGDRLDRLIDRFGSEASNDGGAFAAANRVGGWDDVAQASRRRISFGSHTETHPFLHRQPADAIRRELAGSRETLESRLGAAVEGFAYPGGHLTDEVTAAVADAGYRWAVTTERGSNGPQDSPHRLRRINLWNGSMTAAAGRFSRSLLAMHLVGALG